MTTHTEFAKALVAIWQKSQSASNEQERKVLWNHCFQMCEAEQDSLLKAGYAESTLIKVLTPKYRKAIAIEANLLDSSVKGGYRYTEYPMAFWKIDQGSRTEIDTQTKIRTGQKKKDSIRVPVECREALLTLANDLLETPVTSAQSIWKKALAVSLLTGRRFYVEVSRNGQFYELEEVTDHNRCLAFVGQAKGGVEKAQQLYEIPCYAENIELLIHNTEQIQEFVKSKDWFHAEMSAQAFQSKIKSQCELALKIFNDITMPYGFALTIKDLRALYMSFAYYDYKVLSGRHPDIDTYIGSIAGHDVKTESGTYYRVGTTEHYKAFIDARWDD